MSKVIIQYQSQNLNLNLNKIIINNIFNNKNKNNSYKIIVYIIYKMKIFLQIKRTLK